MLNNTSLPSGSAGPPQAGLRHFCSAFRADGTSDTIRTGDSQTGTSVKKQFIVTIGLRAKDGKAAELEKHLRDRVPISRTEAGILDYRLYRSTTDGNVFFLFTRYADEKAWDLHLYQPYTLSLMAGFEDLLQDPPRVETYEAILG